MRKLKTLGASAIALLALAIAGTGADSASATVLCRSRPSSHVCPAADILAGPSRSSAVTATATNSRMVTSGGLLNPTITCGSSTANFTEGPGGGAGVSLPGRLTGLSFTRCTSTNPTGCSASAIVTGLPTTDSIRWIPGTWDGSFDLTEPDVEFDCPFLGATIRCHYGLNVVTGTIRGGSPATLVFQGVSLGSVNGSPCPPSIVWSATYTISSPSPLYIEDQ
jgi:hypothetical protein